MWQGYTEHRGWLSTSARHSDRDPKHALACAGSTGIPPSYLSSPAVGSGFGIGSGPGAGFGKSGGSTIGPGAGGRS